MAKAVMAPNMRRIPEAMVRVEAPSVDTFIERSRLVRNLRCRSYVSEMKRGLRQSRISELVIDGKPLPVTLRRRRDARRIILRMDRAQTGIVLTYPYHTSQKAALDFASAQARWILTRIERRPERVPFAAGESIPLRGIPHEIRQAGKRGTVSITEEQGRAILVPGEAVHLNRRLSEWLKRQAVLDLTEASRKHAGKLGVRVRKVGVRDTISRWGSCSSSGVLSYSWRLILAPPLVLDYVAAHEVAHLQEMNHGPEFWAIVEWLCAATGEARQWLRTHGNGLHLYGAR